MKAEFRNNCSKSWSVKTFDFIPYLRILSSEEKAEIEIGWLCFCITFIWLKVGVVCCIMFNFTTNMYLCQ
jgi:hypothetical protein